MRRMFWTALGLGAGVSGAVMVSRWMRRQRARLAPANIGAQVARGARDLNRLFREAIHEGRVAMAEKEREIRAAVPLSD